MPKILYICLMKKCEHCGSGIHASFQCFNRPRKAIERNKQLTNKPSSKRALERVIYDENKKLYLSKIDCCEHPGCESTILTLHHLAGRTGRLYTDMDNFIALCPEHHVWAENNPEESKRIGISKSSTENI